jgi:hypothetical protein
MRSIAALFTVLVAASLTACGGGATPGGTTPPTGTGTPEAAVPGAPTAWSDGMTKDQQMAFMKTVIMPKMTPVFQAGDAKHYADVSCKTCHGPNYQAPKDFLPKLTMKDGKITSFAEKPEVSKFMAEKIVPAMAAAMGKPPYDPATHQGFGCAGCHAVEMK